MSRMPVLFVGHGSPMNAIEDNVYSRGLNLEANLGGKQHVYMPVGGSERGEDYEMLRFREMVRDG